MDGWEVGFSATAPVGDLIVVGLEGWEWVERGGPIFLVEIIASFLIEMVVVEIRRWQLPCLARGFLITEGAPLMMSFVTLGVIPETEPKGSFLSLFNNLVTHLKLVINLLMLN